MFQIIIVKVPQGEAPDWVRQAWLGTTLPCIGVSHSSAHGVLSGEPANHGCMGYYVPQHLACEVLAKTDPAAAAWWKEKGYPKPEHSFVFYENEVVVLEESQREYAWG